MLSVVGVCGIMDLPFVRRSRVVGEPPEMIQEPLDTSQQRKLIEQLCNSYGIAELYAFGSRAREALAWVEQGIALSPGSSDLDLGVRTKPGVRWSIVEKASAALDFEDLFHVARVDLVLLPEADPFLAAAIIRGERLFITDSHAADEYELYVLRCAGDLLPLERERIALILGLRQ